MIQKFATVPGSRVALALILATILTGASTVHAQQTPAQQPPQQQPPAKPENPQSSSQEASPEETMPGRKPKVKEYKNWTFNVGGGGSLTRGTTETFVRSGGALAAAGVARNYSKYFGLRLDFQWDNLPLRNSALQLAQAPGATSHVYTFSLDPIINIPLTKTWGGYVLGGLSYYHRSGKLDSSTAIPGSACTPFFSWWGTCSGVSLPVNGKFLSSSENQFGENFGGGVTYKIRPNIQLYGEWRLLHGKGDGSTTDLRPITFGVRW
jgi:opacity protein-like surface antigen